MQSVIANYKKKKILIKKTSKKDLNSGFTALPIKNLTNINKTSQFRYRNLKRKKEIKRNNKMAKKNNNFKETLQKNLQNFEEKSLRKSSLIKDQLLKQKSVIREKLKRRRERSLSICKSKGSFISKLKNKYLGKSEVFDNNRVLDKIGKGSIDFVNKNLGISIIEGSIDNSLFSGN